jgi:hypothetical protein
MKRLPKPLVLTAAFWTVGCYTFAPAPARLVEPGTEVKVHLNTTRSVDLSSVTVRDVNLVEGQLTRWTDANEAVVFSSYLQTRPGIRQQTSGELVSIPEGQIEVMDAPKLDGAKTAVAIGAGVAALVGLVAIIGGMGNKGGAGSGGDGGGGSQGAVIAVPFGR